MEPVRPLLEFGAVDRWQSGLDVLLRVGHSTGRAYAYSIAAAMCLLGGVGDVLGRADLGAPRRRATSTRQGRTQRD